MLMLVTHMMLGRNDEATLADDVIFLVDNDDLARYPVIGTVKTQEMEEPMRILPFDDEHPNHDDNRGGNASLALFDTMGGRDDDTGQNSVNVEFRDNVANDFFAKFRDRIFFAHGGSWLTVQREPETPPKVKKKSQESL